MAKFTYSFQQLLDWQVDLENQSKTRISNLLKERTHLEQYLKDLESSQRGFFEKLALLPERTLWASFENSQVEKYRSERKKTFTKLDENLDRIDQERVQLKKVIQKRQMLEELKTKKRREFQMQQNKKDQKVLDEIANRRAGLED